MRLKSFSAKTMTEAMQMVRDALGEDAVIVATREEQGGPQRGGGVRVTAAIDPGLSDDNGFDDDVLTRRKINGREHISRTENEYSAMTTGFQFGENRGEDYAGSVHFETHHSPLKQKSSSRSEWLQYDDENDNASIAEEITDTLLRHCVTEDVMDHVLSCATVVGLETPEIALMAAIEHLFAFAPLPTKGHPKAMMMIGAPGSGKTLAVAKIAARGVMNDQKVGVVTMDTVRAGGLEQLKSFTDLLHINLKTARDEGELKNALNGFNGYDQVISDPAAINPFDKNDIRPLAKIMGLNGIETYAVMPGAIDAEEAGEMGRVYSTIGVHALIPTRIDMARRLGSILTASHQGQIPLSHASNTPKVADGLVEMTPKYLTRLLMPHAFRDKLLNEDTNNLRNVRQAS